MAIGYIALWRKIEDHEFYKEKREYSKLEAWIDILLETQHCEEPKDVVIKMKVFKCYYGESLKSLRTWGSRWGWSEAKVKRFFNLLTNMGQIQYKSETVTTRIKVLNYYKYDLKNNKGVTQSKRNQNDSETRPPTDNKDNKEKKGKNDKAQSDGHENYGSFSKQIVSGFTYPETYSGELIEKFEDFIKNRNFLKKKVTDIAFKSLVKKLNQLSNGDDSLAIEILERSIMNGWAGIFEIKDRKTKPKFVFNLED